jgi:hypothetical protein
VKRWPFIVIIVSVIVAGIATSAKMIIQPTPSTVVHVDGLISTNAFVFHEGGSELVSISGDGHVDTHGLEPDEAARVFWKAVRSMGACGCQDTSLAPTKN